MELGKIEIGVVSFIHNEIAAKATGLNKFLIYTATGLAAGKFEKLIVQYEPLLRTFDVITENGIEIDKLYKVAKNAMKETGTVQLYGVILDENDIEKLYKYIKSA